MITKEQLAALIARESAEDPDAAATRVWVARTLSYPPFAGWVWITPRWVWDGYQWVWQEGQWAPPVYGGY